MSWTKVLINTVMFAVAFTAISIGFDYFTAHEDELCCSSADFTRSLFIGLFVGFAVSYRNQKWKEE